MKWPTPLIAGTLERRYKRFFADVRLAGGEQVTAHCPNTGSMRGCDRPGSPVMLSPAASPTRKLPYTWELVEADGTWVGINTARPNAIVAEAIEHGAIAPLSGASRIRREVPYGGRHRIDLLLETPAGPIYVEVKNTTLARDGVALFPDAVTTRGTRHLNALIEVVKNGGRAAMVFLIQRGDCDRFAPAADIDPDYAEALGAARRAGVLMLPCRARVTPDEVTLTGPVPMVAA